MGFNQQFNTQFSGSESAPFAAYTDLTNAIQIWMARIGDANLVGNLDMIVALAEQRITYGSLDPQFSSKPLRIRAMEATADIVIGTPLTGATVGGTANAITLTPTSAISSYTDGLLYQFSPTANNLAGGVTLNVSGVGATSVTKSASRAALAANDLISGGTYNVYYDAINSVWVLLSDIAHAPLPPGYLSMRRFSYFWNTFVKSLDYMQPALFDTLYVNQITGPPQQYTIEQDQFRFGRVPDTTYFGKCLYYQQFAPIAGNQNAPNWLFLNAPGVYLYGSLLEASIFVDDPDNSARFYRLFGAAVNALQAQDIDDRFSGASLQIRNTTGNP